MPHILHYSLWRCSFYGHCSAYWTWLSLKFSNAPNFDGTYSVAPPVVKCLVYQCNVLYTINTVKHCRTNALLNSLLPPTLYQLSRRDKRSKNATMQSFKYELTGGHCWLVNNKSLFRKKLLCLCLKQNRKITTLKWSLLWIGKKEKKSVKPWLFHNRHTTCT